MKTKTLLRAALLLLAGLATCLAPIETRASDSCYQSATMPQPTASTGYSSYIYISWTSISASCYAFYSPRYVVYRSTSSTFSWSGVSRLATTTNRYYYDYSAVAGRTYYYWIGVVDESDESVWVNYDKKDWGKRADNCFATASLPQPSASTSYSSYVKVTWPTFTSCSPFGGRYVVYRSTSSTFSWSTAKGIAVTTSTTYYDYSAVAGTKYWYWIGVVDNAGATWVNYDKKDWGKRADNCFATASLPQPSASTSYSDYVKVTWSAFTGCSPFGGKYVVYRSTSSTFSWSTAKGIAVTYSTTYYDYSAVAGTKYWYWIGVVDNAGATWVNYDKKDWGKRADNCFATASLPRPTTYSFSSYIKIEWPAFTSCSPFGGKYVIYRSTSSTFSWSSVRGLAVTYGTTYYDYSAVAGTTYYYWIGVVDNAGATWVDPTKYDYYWLSR